MDEQNKNKDIKLCPNCGEDKAIIKYGIRNSNQRYKCKTCKSFFSEKTIENPRYDRSSKKALSFLLNLLENNFWGKDKLAEAIQSTDNYYKKAIKVKFDNHYAIENKDNSKIIMSCYKPKLLICQDENEITFIQIPSYNKSEERTITIYDRKELHKDNKKFRKPFLKE